ncbi:MAG TPA: T9SS type A sorting domain-containing protein [Flavobacteriales bacterium]|nr:T9SS type A sorting domain-containing protein [Flavobacteriales bacterium]
MERLNLMDMNFKKIAYIFFGLALCSSFTWGQEVTYDKTPFAGQKIAQVYPGEITEDWMPSLTNVEMPLPGSSRHAMNQIKKQSEAKYPRKAIGIQSWDPSGTAPGIGMNFPVASKIILPNGDTLISLIPGGTPNDNTLAISDSGIVLTSFNSRLFAYDSNLDTAEMLVSLHAFTAQFTNNDKYDPKVIYDPIADRFILVFLNGRQSYESLIIVCFSTTNDPADPWNLYSLPGNPLSDSTWTDYPAISVTEGELFVTGNLINDVAATWQTGFSESVIWQVDKQNGYDGDSLLTTTLWSNLKYLDTLIRNIHPVQGGSWPVGPSQYLLSNRNFSILSDSIFLLEVTGDQYDGNTVLDVNLGKSNVPYGMPPNGRQSHVDSLATNDARVLGAFIENGEIQYVSVTLDTSTGFAAIYHGFVNNLDADPVFTATILVDDSLDLGYPNIAYTGSHSCSRQAIIGMDHTSPTRDPGVSALLYHSNDTYSELISLKEAEGPVNKISGYERWGDYFGIQRKYNDNNTVWTAGFYGKSNNNFTWITELTAEVELPLAVSITDVDHATTFQGTDGALTVTVGDGFTPYQVQWNDPDKQTGFTATGLGQGTYTVTIIDDAECVVRDSMVIEEAKPQSNVFPNPAVDLVTLYFELEKSGTVEVKLYDTKGALVKDLYSDKAKAGSNFFSFSMSPLNAGSYVLRITSKGADVLTRRLIKQ